MSETSGSESAPILLRVVAGAEAKPFRCAPGATVRIGRAANNDLCLLSDAVSRRHCLITDTNEGWALIDQNSTAGTWANGVKLEPGVPTPIGVGDLITVGAALVRVAAPDDRGSVVRTVDDRRAAGTLVEGARARVSAGRRLDALTALFDHVAGLRDEADIARCALDAAIAGTSFTRAAFVRVHDEEGAEIELVAQSVRHDGAGAPTRPFSRSLIQQARSGELVTLRTRSGSGVGHADIAASVAEHGVRAALCAPVGTSELVEGLLYLDSDDERPAPLDDPSGFAASVARVLAMAMGNARRARLEARQHEMRLHLDAAREAQRAIMAPEHGEAGPITYAVRMRPGLILAGDLFDVIPLSDGRAVLFLGDAAGHGPASAILMCAAQAFLQAQLHAGRSLAPALVALNDYVCSIRTGGRFITLWVGVVHPGGMVEYCDAGHAHVIVLRADGRIESAGGATAPPVGVAPGEPFETRQITLSPSDTLVLYSDGVVEQTNDEGEEFEKGRLEAAARGRAGAAPRDVVESIDNALTTFAGQSAWRDDATVACATLR